MLPGWFWLPKVVGGVVEEEFPMIGGMKGALGIDICGGNWLEKPNI